MKRGGQDEAWQASFRRVVLLKRALAGYKSLLDVELQPLGLTLAQMSLMRAAQTSPGISGAKLSEMCSITPQSGHELIARLEALGWISREKSPVNERVLVASVTEAGEEVLLRARKVGEALSERMWSGFDAEALRAFDEVMETVVKRLDREKE